MRVSERVVGSHGDDSNGGRWPDTNTFTAMVGNFQDIDLFRYWNTFLDVSGQQRRSHVAAQK